MNAAINEQKALILNVDDDRDILETMSIVLESAGYEVVSATNGKDRALARLQRGEKPALIILDLMMPVMNGWQFREAQLADPALAEIPVVVISGGGAPAKNAAELHAEEYLQKPVELAALLSAVARHKGGRAKPKG